LLFLLNNYTIKKIVEHKKNENEEKQKYKNHFFRCNE
jgi:hypothetical protein